MGEGCGGILIPAYARLCWGATTSRPPLRSCRHLGGVCLLKMLAVALRYNPRAVEPIDERVEPPGSSHALPLSSLVFKPRIVSGACLRDIARMCVRPGDTSARRHLRRRPERGSPPYGHKAAR